MLVSSKSKKKKKKNSTSEENILELKGISILSS